MFLVEVQGFGPACCAKRRQALRGSRFRGSNQRFINSILTGFSVVSQADFNRMMLWVE
jgi:hypothetical protein